MPLNTPNGLSRAPPLLVVHPPPLLAHPRPIRAFQRVQFIDAPETTLPPPVSDTLPPSVSDAPALPRTRHPPPNIYPWRTLVILLAHAFPDIPPPARRPWTPTPIAPLDLATPARVLTPPPMVRASTPPPLDDPGTPPPMDECPSLSLTNDYLSPPPMEHRVTPPPTGHRVTPPPMDHRAIIALMDDRVTIPPMDERLSPLPMYCSSPLPTPPPTPDDFIAGSPEIRVAALRALRNSLNFASSNFNVEQERSYIMQVLCSAVISPNVDVQVIAFECLVEIVSMYYRYMEPYMDNALYNLTASAMGHTEPLVQMQALEFWSTICERESDLEENPRVDTVSLDFAKKAVAILVPQVLQLLTQQDEDAEDDEWDVHQAASVCLTCFASRIQDDIVSFVLPFVEANVRSPDWRFRDAAVMAFGCVAQGPSSEVIGPLIKIAFPVFLEMLQDPHVGVRDTAAWALGRIAENHAGAIAPEMLGAFVDAILASLQGPPSTVATCCWIIMSLANNASELAGGGSAQLATYYEPLVAALVGLSGRMTNQSNFRTSAYEALSSLVAAAPDSCLPTVSYTLDAMLARCEELLNVHGQIVAPDDRNNYDEIQVNIMAFVTNVVRRVGPEIEPIADRIMTAIIRLLETVYPGSPVPEDAFICVGALVEALETAFSKYVQPILPYLIAALQDVNAYQLCRIAVGVVGDICRGLGTMTPEAAAGFMQVLIADINLPTIPPPVKPAIISAFADVALAAGLGFGPWVGPTMEILYAAGQVTANAESDQEHREYTLDLHDAVLEAYIGIVAAFKNNTAVISPYVGQMFAILATVHEEMTHSAIRDDFPTQLVALLGDLAEAFPNGELSDYFISRTSQKIIKDGAQEMQTGEKRKMIRWAREMVRRASGANA